MDTAVLILVFTLFHWPISASSPWAVQVATERSVFYRERAAHMYHPLVLNAVAALCELPYITLNTFVFTCIFYWMVGLNEGQAPAAIGEVNVCRPIQ